MEKNNLSFHNDLREEVFENIRKVDRNIRNVRELETQTVLFLNNFLTDILNTGNCLITIINNEQEKIDIFNKLIFSGLNNIKLSGITNWEYIQKNPNNRFFVTDNSITEISFQDSLDIWEEVDLTEFSDKMFCVELTFKSKRVKMREENIVKNKFRFVYTKSNNKVTCRRLNE